MKKYTPYIVIFVTLLLVGQILTSLIKSSEQSPIEENNSEQSDTGYVDVYLFHGDGCPHCADEKTFLKEYEANNPQRIELHSFEVWNSDKNQEIFQEVAKKLNAELSGVPFTVIGDEYVSGFASDDTTGKEITNLIDKCYDNVCPDSTYRVIYNKDKPQKSKPGEDTTTQSNDDDSEIQSDNLQRIDLPFGKSIDTQKYSLPFLTITIGFFDGFNPCAMWVLLYLISMLLGMKNKKKMWILGVSFIAASALTYFVFLAAWLEVFQIINYVKAIRYIVGIVAIGSGAFHINKYFTTNDDGCEVVDKEKRKKIFAQIKNITSSKKFIAALVGIVTLAFSINLIELVCSAGLPAIYTNILSTHNIARWQHYSYLLLYILVYMLDDIAIFVIAMLSLKAVGISKKYQKLSSIIGGIIIFIVGFLLIFKPEWLMWG